MDVIKARAQLDQIMAGSKVFEFPRLSGARTRYFTAPWRPHAPDGYPKPGNLSRGWYTWEVGRMAETLRKEEGDDVNDFDRFARAGFTILPPL